MIMKLNTKIKILNSLKVLAKLMLLPWSVLVVFVTMKITSYAATNTWMDLLLFVAAVVGTSYVIGAPILWSLDSINMKLLELQYDAKLVHKNTINEEQQHGKRRIH